MIQEALFDPGFAPLVYSFSESVEAINQVMSGVKIPNQRKFRFQSFQPKIVEIVENNVSFYLGCLMWAKYLKEEMPNQEIIGNSFLGVDLAEMGITKDDICNEIDCFIEYFDKYTRDCKFYLGKNLKLDEKWLEIARVYREFLLLNNSFIATKTTRDLVLPESVFNVLKHDNLANKELIDKALKTKKLAIMLE